MGGFFGGGGSAAGIGGSTGATDNAILRADGTGGASLQNSALVVEDAVGSFSCTGVASTDVITAVGHNFTTNQYVRFLSLTGGSGLSINTNYYVRDISGDTFKVSSSSGGSAVNFTTDITAGTIVAGGNPLVQIKNNASDANSSVVITPKGNGAFFLSPPPDGTATGGNQRGINAVDLQIVLGAASRVASGQNSLCAGGNCTASGTNSQAFGNFTFVSGTQSVGFGSNCNATANRTFTAGFTNTSSAEGCFSIGVQSVADRYYIFTHAAGNFSAIGDAQRLRAVLRNKTTTNSAVELFLDGGTTPTRFTIPSGKVCSMLINITGVKSDGSAVAHYVRQYSLKNVAGTTSEVYAPVTIGTDNAAGTSISITASDANDAINISVTGITSETWRWVASIDAVEVAYGT